SGGRLTQLTGANSDGTARVRQMTGFHRTYYTKGAPAPALSVAKMRLAAQLAEALHQLEQSPHKQRIERSVRTFREACESHALDQRLHQFVRCAEAVASPRNGIEFTRRMSRVCAGQDRKSTRLNSSHGSISYALFCLKKQAGAWVRPPRTRPAMSPATIKTATVRNLRASDTSERRTERSRATRRSPSTLMSVPTSAGM